MKATDALRLVGAPGAEAKGTPRRITDRQFRRAVLNLLEDATEARRKQESESAERERAQLEVRKSEERYRSLFMQMEQGFGVADVMLGAKGQAIGLRWLEQNPRFATLLGLAVESGDDRSESNASPPSPPDTFWLESCAHVAATGEALRLERPGAELDSWLDIYMFRVGSPEQHRVAVLVTNVTERVRQAAHAAFLAEVTAEIAERISVVGIAAAIAPRTRSHLSVASVHLVAVEDSPEDLRVVARDLAQQRSLDFVPGEPALEAEVADALQNGDTLVADASRQATGVSGRACLAVPIGVIRGRAHGLVVLDQPLRVWRADEIETAHEIASRLALRLDAVEAEAAWREKDQVLRFILDNARDFAIVSFDLDRHVLSWNAGATAVVGYSAEEVMGKLGDFIFTPEDRAAGVPAMEAQTAIDEAAPAMSAGTCARTGRDSGEVVS